MSVTIVDEGTYSEPMHHALDEVLLDRLDSGDIDPTLRFWYRGAPRSPSAGSRPTRTRWPWTT